MFDSKYDSFKGVVAYVRVMDGQIKARDRARSSWIRAHKGRFWRLGIFRLRVMRAPEGLRVGEVGYVATGYQGRGRCDGGGYDDVGEGAGGRCAGEV